MRRRDSTAARRKIDDRVYRPADHWDTAYQGRATADVSWYEPTAKVSLELIASLRLPLDAPVIDIGGGESSLASELVARGHTDVSVLDVSAVALSKVQAQLGTAVSCLRDNVLKWKPERRYELWHDRAVLHFFTEDRDCLAYLRAVDAGVSPGGFVVLGEFGPDGPARCSGLPVRRYSPGDLRELFGDGYELLKERNVAHITPRGTEQQFTWVALQRRKED